MHSMFQFFALILKMSVSNQAVYMVNEKEYSTNIPFYKQPDARPVEALWKNLLPFQTAAKFLPW